MGKSLHLSNVSIEDAGDGEFFLDLYANSYVIIEREEALKLVKFVMEILGVPDPL